jgi:hypothetical protein
MKIVLKNTDVDCIRVVVVVVHVDEMRPCLKCGHQRAHRSSVTLYVIMENHGGMILTG